MDKQEQKLEQQNVQNKSKVENNNNLELAKKLDVLENSSLKDLKFFDKFISYLSIQTDTTKLDNVLSILQSQEWKENEIYKSNWTGLKNKWNLLTRYKSSQISWQNHITLVKYWHSLLFNSK